MFGKKKAQQLIMIGLKNLFVPKLQNGTQQHNAELSIVWKRGSEQTNESMPFEVSNKEHDIDIQDTFYRVCKFKISKKGLAESKWCEFSLKQCLDGFSKDGKQKYKILDTIKYDMSRHFNPFIPPKVCKTSYVTINGKQSQFETMNVATQNPSGLIILQFVDKGQFGLVELAFELTLSDAKDVNASNINTSLKTMATSKMTDSVMENTLDQIDEKLHMSEMQVEAVRKKTIYTRKATMTQKEAAKVHRKTSKEVRTNTTNSRNFSGNSSTSNWNKRAHQSQITPASNLHKSNMMKPENQDNFGGIIMDTDVSELIQQDESINFNDYVNNDDYGYNASQNIIYENEEEQDVDMGSLEEIIQKLEESRRFNFKPSEDLIVALIDSFNKERDNLEEKKLSCKNLKAETDNVHADVKKQSKDNFIIKNNKQGVSRFTNKIKTKIEMKHVNADLTKVHSLKFRYQMQDQNNQKIIQLRQKVESQYKNYYAYEQELQNKIAATQFRQNQGQQQYNQFKGNMSHPGIHKRTSLITPNKRISLSLKMPRGEILNLEKPTSKVSKNMIEDKMNKLIDKAFKLKGVSHGDSEVLTKSGCKEFLQELYIEKGFSHWNEEKFNKLYDRFENDENKTGMKRLVMGLDRVEFRRLVMRVCQF